MRKAILEQKQADEKARALRQKAIAALNGKTVGGKALNVGPTDRLPAYV